MLYENCTLEEQDIRLDYNSFRNVIFRNCRVHFAGGSIDMEACKFENLELILEGPALTTQHLLNYLQGQAIKMGGTRIETPDAVFERVLRKDV